MLPKQRGFTLIEVMIVVVIIGILASIAYPSYQEYVWRANRAEGQAFLQDVSARQERYFSQNNSYVTKDADIADLGLSSSASSETGKYTLTVAVVSGDSGYTLTGNNQFNDPQCGNLTLTARGVKGRTGTVKSVNECWR